MPAHGGNLRLPTASGAAKNGASDAPGVVDARARREFAAPGGTGTRARQEFEDPGRADTAAWQPRAALPHRFLVEKGRTAGSGIPACIAGCAAFLRPSCCAPLGVFIPWGLRAGLPITSVRRAYDKWPMAMFNAGCIRARACVTFARQETHIAHVKANLPPGGVCARFL
jgi:hypothetical protein